MSQKMSLNFYNDGERIKNHMVEFLSNTGSVSKTLFGIELGTVCKTPNRGRTKLIIDTYPDVFITEGDAIKLRNAPPKRQFSTHAFDAMFGEPQMGEIVHCSPMPSQQLSSCSMYSEPHMGELIHHSPAQSQQHSGCYNAAPSVTSQLSVPMQDNNGKDWYTPPYQSPTPSYCQLDMMNFSSPYATSPVMYPTMFQNQFQAYQEAPHADKNDSLSSGGYQDCASTEECFQKSLGQQYSSDAVCQYVPPSEAIVLELLNRNGGSMEISELVISMGIAPSDSQEQGKLYTLLSDSPSIGIEGDEIYVVNTADDQALQEQLVMEPTMEALPDMGLVSNTQGQSANIPTQEQPVQEFSTTGTNYPTQEQPAQEKSATGTQCEDNDGNSEGERNEGNSGASVPAQSAPKTVRVGTISIQNINIKTVNLHLHVEDSKKSQVSELLKFQSMMQDMLSSFKQSS